MAGMKDLYQFVNGPWLNSHVIPDDRGVDGTFHNLVDEFFRLVTQGGLVDDQWRPRSARRRNP